MGYMFLPLKRYAEFSGRSRRLEYWLFVLFQILLYTGLFVACFAAMVNMAPANDGVGLSAILGLGAFLLIAGLVWLILLVPSIAVTVRRLHDSGRSGWWFGIYLLASVGLNLLTGAAMGAMAASAQSPEQLLQTAGMVNGIAGLAMFGYAVVLFIFFCLDGTPGPNRYGPDPKGRANAGNVFA